MALLTKEQLNSLVSHLFTVADGAGSTREEMRAALDTIADLTDPNTLIEEQEDGAWEVVEPEPEDEDEDESDESEDE